MRLVELLADIDNTATCDCCARDLLQMVGSQPGGTPNSYQTLCTLLYSVGFQYSTIIKWNYINVFKVTVKVIYMTLTVV